MQWITDIAKQAIKDAIRELIREDAGEKRGYLSEKAAADYFGVTLRTWRGWVEKGLIREYTIGGRPFFKMAEVEKLAT